MQMKTLMYTAANILGICLVGYFAWELPDNKFYGIMLGLYLHAYTFKKGWQF